MTFVQRVAWALVIVGLAAPLAVAGPNAGGVLVVHTSNLAYSSDATTYIGQSGIACGQDGPEFFQVCPPYDPLSGPNPCVPTAANPTSAQPADASQIWFVLAAFPSTSCPRLKAVAFGFNYNERWSGNAEGKVVIFAWGYADPGDPNLVFGLLTNSTIDDRPFPASGANAALNFLQARTSQLQELMWFAGYAYSDGSGEAKFNLAGHGNTLNRFFIDDTNPPLQDPISAYGSLGFNGTTGTNPPPVTSYACCIDFVCVVHTLDECTTAGGFTNGNYYCDPAVPDVDECANPVEETSWGRVKHQYGR